MKSRRKPQRRSRFNAKKRATPHFLKKGAERYGHWEERGMGEPASQDVLEGRLVIIIIYLLMIF